MRIDIIGTGLGPGTLTPDGARAIAQAQLLIGSRRLIESLAHPGQTTHIAVRSEAIIAALNTSSAESVSILMSGDVGFHSGAIPVAAWLRDNRPDIAVTLIPGLATPMALAARIGLPWENAHLVSGHSADINLVSSVRRQRHTIALTGGNVPALARNLVDAGFGDLTAWAGEDLGLASECLTQTSVAGLAARSWSSLTALLIENPTPDDRVLSGLPDEVFARGRVPMTKAAVRALSLARLAVRPTDTCYDIGCGTGAVTVELALAAHSGEVYGVDQNPEAVALTRANCRAFHIGNVTVREGSAPDALAAWPVPDVAFVGGTSGSMLEIVGAITARNPAVRIAVTAIAVESAAAAIGALTSVGLTPEVTQVAIANGQAVGGLHLMRGQNPVTIVSGGGDA
jgi:precorrin-6Y C5,15-methyltransferase (decarboxylating)